jgi:hypothetical protein
MARYGSFHWNDGSHYDESGNVLTIIKPTHMIDLHRFLTNPFDDGMSDTAKNVNSVDGLGLAIEDPPSQNQVQQVADRLDELIGGLHR